ALPNDVAFVKPDLEQLPRHLRPHADRRVGLDVADAFDVDRHVFLDDFGDDNGDGAALAAAAAAPAAGRRRRRAAARRQEHEGKAHGGEGYEEAPGHKGCVSTAYEPGSASRLRSFVI